MERYFEKTDIRTMQIHARGGITESLRTINMDLHPGVQRDIAAYTRGAAIKVRCVGVGVVVGGGRGTNA